MSSTGSPPPRLSELIAALPVATDLGLGEPMEHMLRSCLISIVWASESDCTLPSARRAHAVEAEGRGVEVEARCGVGRHTV